MGNEQQALQLILASASPRRAELLQQIGLRFVVKPQHVPEEKQADESPQFFVERLACDKAAAGWEATGHEYDLPVLGSDTIVVIDDEVLGKPVDEADGLAMLARLSGHEHRVMTAVAVAKGGRIASAISISTVRFRELTRQEVSAYWQTGEPADKAGGYGIQGVAGQFVEHLEGSYSGVVGLPLCETASLLRQFGVQTL